MPLTSTSGQFSWPQWPTDFDWSLPDGGLDDLGGQSCGSPATTANKVSDPGGQHAKITGELSVFSERGHLRADSLTTAGSNSCIVELHGPISAPDSVLYVEARIIEPAEADGEPIPGASYRLQITSEPFETGAVGSNQGTSTADSIMIGTTGKAARVPGSLQHQQSSAGASSPGPGSMTGDPGGFAPDVFPSWIGAAGDATAGNEGIALASVTSPGANAPIDVSPLPATSYEPAGGVFSLEEVAARDDRLDETRVEMSLVRIVSPGREESR